MSVQLLHAAVEHAQRHGARNIEGYPIDADARNVAAAFAWTGTQRAFEMAGFSECAQRSPTRPIMRRRCVQSTFL
ncbi:hypothetical protein BH24PSE2_BH24PSE2_20510 [soil metagenome]